jgi:hypothetical protein
MVDSKLPGGGKHQHEAGPWRRAARGAQGRLLKFGVQVDFDEGRIGRTLVHVPISPRVLNAAMSS